MAATTTESRVHAVLLGYFPMFIATLSLLTSIYNGYLNAKFVDLIRHNVNRTESMRTCKEIIDAYFQAKMRIGALSTTGERASEAAQADAENAVAKFAALGTYLANLGGEASRARYTELSVALEKLASEARRVPAGDLTRRYEAPDRAFADMNTDCIKSAKDSL